MLESDEELRRRVTQRVGARSGLFTHALAYALVVGGMWGVGFLIGLGWWLPLAVTLGWGAGLAAHAIDVYYSSGAPALRRDDAVRREMRDLYGDDWRETGDKEAYDQLYDRLTAASSKRKELLIHSAVYVLINLGVWLTWYSFGAESFALPLLVTLGWGIGYVFHLADVFTSGGRERQIERGLERERERVALASGKAKRKRKNEEAAALQVGDDGELVSLDDLDLMADEPRKLRNG